MNDSSLDTRTTFGRWVYLVVILAVVAVYVQSLGGPFVWDDRHLILKSPQIREEGSLIELFLQPFWVDAASDATRTYYRPLTILSFVADYRLHGENPAGYHLTNLALHTLNAALLLGVLRKYGVRQWTACALSLAWALSPRLAEAAAWISGRTDVLAGTFVLLALAVHRPRSGRRSLLVGGLLLCGLFAKEVALAGFVAVAASELTFKDRRSPLLFLAPLVGALAIYVPLRLHALRGISQERFELPLGERPAAALEALGRYATNVANPWFPEVQQGLIQHPAMRYVVLGGAISVACLVGGGLLLARRRKAGAGASSPSVQERTLRAVALGLGGTSLALVLHVVPLPLNVISADRFLYLPLAACALGLGYPLSRWLDRTRRLAFFVASYVATLAFACVPAVGMWSDEIGLWLNAFRSTPRENGVPTNELGNVYYRAGLYDHSRALYGVGVAAADSRIWSLRLNFANSLSQLGRYDEARRELRALPELRANATSLISAARVELHELRLDAARAFVREATSLAPDLADGPKVLAQIDAVAEALGSSELTSSDAAARAVARFRVASLAGRRTEALEIAEQLLGDPRVDVKTRTDAVELWVRWGAPERLTEMLTKVSRTTPVADELLVAAQYRVTESRRLLEAWPSLGVDL